MATQSYTTPGSYTFTLPVSTNITIRVAGASGGSGGIDACVNGAPNVSGGTGGNGRYAEFILSDYTYGELTINVGGSGGNGLNVGQTAFAGGSGGTNGGGTGGDDRPGGSSGGGGGGGGCSSISYNGNQIVIAGGGGGGGGASLCNYLGPVDTGFSYNGGNAKSFSSTTSSISVTNGENGDGNISTGGDGGGVGGGGGGSTGGLAGPTAGNDQQGGAAAANRAAGGQGGGSAYRSDILILSSQSTNTGNGYVEIVYTAVVFDTSAATVSKAGPYYASGAISFSSLRSNFRAQQPKTTSGGSESFNSDTASISASELLRDTDVNETNPIVPQCEDNLQISSSSDWKVSQFRNSIKYYYLTQESDKTTLNYVLHGQPWDGNLSRNIVKKFFLEGTCGSIDSAQAALQLNADVYNLSLIITGSVLGAGGSSGAKGDKNQSDGTVTADSGDGGDGGDAISINTNNTGTVTIKTSGSSAQVYGGGGGGGGGGWGGNGADGSYTTYYSYYESTGQAGTFTDEGGKQYYQMCQSACQRAHGAEWANNCYKEKFSEYPQNCGGNPSIYSQAVCWSNQQAGHVEVSSCRRTVSGSTTTATTGGHGGDGTAGGDGQGYLQTKTGASNPTTLAGTLLGQPDGPTARSHTSAGRAGKGGKGGDGGDWGSGGGGGSAGLDGYASDDITVNESPGGGGDGGEGGYAVSGSGYVIDSSGVDSAYKGSK